MHLTEQTNETEIVLFLKATQVKPIFSCVPNFTETLQENKFQIKIFVLRKIINILNKSETMASDKVKVCIVGSGNW